MNKAILQEFEALVSQLSYQQKLDFGVALAKKMLPFYVCFSETYQFGNAVFLQNTIEAIQKNSQQKEAFWQMKDKICPDTEDFPSNYLTVAALDTCALIYEILLFAEDQKQEHWESILSLFFNIPFMYLDDFSKTPYQEDLMKTEINFLKNLIQQIKENKILPKLDNEWLGRILTTV